MSTHNLCFRAKIRKNVYPCTPQLYYIKVGLRGYTLHGNVILMQRLNQHEHSLSLIRVFTVSMKKATALSYQLSAEGTCLTESSLGDIFGFLQFCYSTYTLPESLLTLPSVDSRLPCLYITVRNSPDADGITSSLRWNELLFLFSTRQEYGYHSNNSDIEKKEQKNKTKSQSFSNYRKVPKFSDAIKLCGNLPKIWTRYLRVFHQKRYKWNRKQ